MMHCGNDAAPIFKTMAEDSKFSEAATNPEDTENVSAFKSGDVVLKRRLSFSSGKETNSADEAKISCEITNVQSVSDLSDSCRRLSTETTDQNPPQAFKTHLKPKNGTRVDVLVKQHNVNDTEEKENAAVPSTTISQEIEQVDDTSGQETPQDSGADDRKQLPITEDKDEVVRRAREEGRVNVVFPGPVTQEGCCRFVSEILKCILYQRQQLPMTYDQLVYSQRKRQASAQDKDAVSRRPVQSGDLDWRKCQQTLQELEEVLQQLEVLFSLSRVPRVLLLMGGSLVLPKELYEINMEDLLSAGGDQCLRVSSCLRQIFRTLFVADLLSDTRPVHLMPTTVLALAHRDCGVSRFRPKLQFKVPTRVRNQIIALSSDPSVCRGSRAEGSDWQDYVWFQAPMTIKGFSK